MSGVAPARDLPPTTTATSSSRPSIELARDRDQRPGVSRQSSTRSELRGSQQPQPQHVHVTPAGHSHGHVHRQSIGSQQAIGAGMGTVQGSGGLASPTARYEELLAQREELEVLKRENEGLRRRIKELEVERRGSGSGSGSGFGADRPPLTTGRSEGS